MKELEKITLSQDDIMIMKIQQCLNKKGYQWKEHIYNDGHSENCSIILTKNNDPSYLSDNILGDTGWGRFSRISCWKQAYNTLITD